MSVSDQPLINSKVFNELTRVFRDTNAPIVASSYAGVIGTPTLFGKNYFSRLRALSGDQGARKLIEQEEKVLRAVEFDRGDIDLDTPEDYFRFTQED